jgi:preprotein translocase subunit Sec63
MTIITKGMGAIIKNLGKKRKTLTISGSSPKKRTVIIKKPSKTKLADTWQDRRIDAINRKIKRRKGSHSQYIDEVGDIYKSKASTKKVYKSIQKKWHSLTPDQKREIYMKKAKRDPKSFHFDKKKFGKK